MIYFLQNILNDPRMKLVEAKHVRWLSYDNAVNALRRCLPSVLVTVDRQAAEKGDVLALGLKVACTKYKFVAALMMMSDILPHLARLSKLFQVCLND